MLESLSEALEVVVVSATRLPLYLYALRKKLVLPEYELSDHEILVKAIHTFGIAGQVDIAIEEMAELTTALIQHRRGRGFCEDVIAEIADAQIMLEQLAIYFGTQLVAEHKKSKIDRLRNYFNTGDYIR